MINTRFLLASTGFKHKIAIILQWASTSVARHPNIFVSVARREMCTALASSEPLRCTDMVAIFVDLVGFFQYLRSRSAQLRGSVWECVGFFALKYTTAFGYVLQLTESASTHQILYLSLVGFHCFYLKIWHMVVVLFFAWLKKRYKNFFLSEFSYNKNIQNRFSLWKQLEEKFIKWNRQILFPKLDKLLNHMYRVVSQ